jgi:hypothetical protein
MRKRTLPQRNRRPPKRFTYDKFPDYSKSDLKDDADGDDVAPDEDSSDGSDTGEDLKGFIVDNGSEDESQAAEEEEEDDAEFSDDHSDPGSDGD